MANAAPLGTTSDAGTDLGTIFIPEFLQGLHNDLAIDCRGIMRLEADTNVNESAHREIDWLVWGKMTHTVRTGPIGCRDADVCGDGMSPCEAKAQYVETLASQDICYTTFAEGNGEQLRYDAVENSLENMKLNLAVDMNRQFLSSDGANNILFRLVGASETDEGGGNYSYRVTDYGGLSGEEVTLSIKILHLEGELVNFGAAIGGAARAVTPLPANGQSELCITEVSDTVGDTRITVNGQVTGYADGDYVWQSRSATNGVLTAASGLRSLPDMTNNWALGGDPYQNVTESGCPNYEGLVCSNEGDERALTEVLLGTFVSGVLRFGHGKRKPGNLRADGEPKYVLYGNDLTIEEFQRTSTEDERRLTHAGGGLTESGRNVQLGWVEEPRAFNGIPFQEDSLHPGGRIHMVDTTDIRRFSRGPWMGKWMKVKDVPVWARDKCSTSYDALWIALHNFRTAHRNRSGALLDLIPGAVCPS